MGYYGPIALLGLTVAIISAIIALVSLWLSFTGRLPFTTQEKITEIEAYAEAGDTDGYN